MAEEDLQYLREQNLTDDSPIVVRKKQQGELSRFGVKHKASATFAGVDYPHRPDGVLRIVVDEHAINAGLFQLIMTEPGERLMEPEFGMPLRDIHFEQLDEFVFDEIATRVAAAIERWERRIVVEQGIQVGQAYRDDNIEIPHTVQVTFRWAFKDDVDETYLFDAAFTRNFA